jgi:hypothetical protein
MYLEGFKGYQDLVMALNQKKHIDVDDNTLRGA